MLRKIFLALAIALFYLPVFQPVSPAGELVIEDYLFTWYAAKAGTVQMNIQKERDGVAVVLRSLGGKLATLYLAPSEARETGEILARAEELHRRHKESDDRVNEDKIEAGEIRVTFASSYKGADFEIRVNRKRFFTPTVLMYKDQAMKISRSLLKAEEMAEFVRTRIKP